jgi:hypothetical protein
MPDTRTVGIDAYMRGLISFAGTVAPGSLQLLASVGDERNALLMLTVDAEVGAGKITLPAARLSRSTRTTRSRSSRSCSWSPTDADQASLRRPAIAPGCRRTER